VSGEFTDVALGPSLGESVVDAGGHLRVSEQLGRTAGGHSRPRGQTGPSPSRGWRPGRGGAVRPSSRVSFEPIRPAQRCHCARRVPPATHQP
jgi:hypothetical protein